MIIDNDYCIFSSPSNKSIRSCQATIVVHNSVASVPPWLSISGGRRPETRLRSHALADGRGMRRRNVRSSLRGVRAIPKAMAACLVATAPKKSGALHPPWCLNIQKIDSWVICAGFPRVLGTWDVFLDIKVCGLQVRMLGGLWPASGSKTPWSFAMLRRYDSTLVDPSTLTMQNAGDPGKQWRLSCPWFHKIIAFPLISARYHCLLCWLMLTILCILRLIHRISWY